MHREILEIINPEGQMVSRERTKALILEIWGDGRGL